MEYKTIAEMFYQSMNKSLDEKVIFYKGPLCKSAWAGTTFRLVFRLRKSRLERLLNRFSIGWAFFLMPST